VRQLFEPVLGDPDARESLLRGAAKHASVVLDEVTDDAPAQQGGFAVLHGLYWLTVNLAAAGPVVLVVDDVQWCDSASLRYLAYLVKRLEGLPVLLVLGVRTGEPHAEEALLAEIALDASTTVLRPPPLSAEAARMLVRERLGEGADSFVDACHRMTAGNPLLLRQLVRALEDEGIPPDVSHVDTVRAVGSRAVSALVTLRLRRLPAQIAAVARAVAVLGETAELPTVSALAQRTEPEVAAALDALSRSEILTGGDRLCFVHPVIREAVYADLPVGERALHHERAAGLLRRQGAPAEQVAAHLLVSSSTAQGLPSPRVARDLSGPGRPQLDATHESPPRLYAHGQRRRLGHGDRSRTWVRPNGSSCCSTAPSECRRRCRCPAEIPRTCTGNRWSGCWSRRPPAGCSSTPG
jgi:hypothetical protein